MTDLVCILSGDVNANSSQEGGRNAKGVFSNAEQGLHQSKTACRRHSPRHGGYFEVFVQIDSKS